MSNIDKEFDAHWEAQTKGGNQWTTLERLAAKEAFQAGFNCALHQQEQAEPVAWMDEEGCLHTTKESAYFRGVAVTPLYPPSAVPRGYALVPIEPSQKMLDAGYWPCTQGRGSKSVWTAMLAAAPQPKETGE